MLTEPAFRPRWLARAKAFLFPDPEGEIEGAHVQFRTGKYVRFSHPDPDLVTVALHVDGEGRPTFLSLSEPLTSLAKTRVLHALLVSADETQGKGPYTPTISSEFVRSAVHALDEASAAFEAGPADASAPAP